MPNLEDIRRTSTRVAGEYQNLGSLSFAYAQGSLVEGLADDADLDLVLVWADAPPPPAVRPPAGVADAEPSPETFDHPGFNSDRLFVEGQQIDAKHVTVDDVDGWWHEVSAGRGTSGYPMPAIALHGLTNGVIVCDIDGVGSTCVERFTAVPEAFAESVSRRVEQMLPLFEEELELCVSRGDHLLFHSELVQLVRMLFIAWYARRGYWWPHEKRLTTRLRQLNREDLADLEQQVWVGHLSDRLRAVHQLSAALGS